MSFEEAANPIIEKFVDEILNKWLTELRGSVSKLEGEVIDLVNQHKENIVSCLREKMSKIEKECKIDHEVENQLLLALSKLVPAPLPPEQSMIVIAQKVWSEIELASSQAEVLNLLLNKVALRCDGAAIFILRGNNVIGWKAVNLNSANFSNDNINQVSFEFKEGISFYHCHQTCSYISYTPGYFIQDSLLLEKLGNRSALNINIFPIIVKGKCVAFLYVDSIREALDMEAIAYIDLLTNMSSLAIETLTTRRSIIDYKKKIALQKEEKRDEAIEGVKEIQKEEKVEKELEEAKLEMKSKEFEMKEMKLAEVVEEKQEIQRIEVKEVSVEEKAVSIPEDDVKLHEEAKRFARLLVSEIKLYNEAQVALGRENKDLFERLKDDIERSKKMYLERISPKIASTTNYFYEELVRTLAGGDPSALGVDSI